MDGYLPDWEAARSKLRRSLADAPAPFRPDVPVGTHHPWQLIGRAIDERVRLMVGPTQSIDRRNGRPSDGVGTSDGIGLGRVLPALQAKLRRAPDEIRAAVNAAPADLTAALCVAQGSAAQDEELLARYCYLAALFDVRGGISQAVDWLLCDGAATSLESWVTRVPPAAVDDLVQLAALAAPVFHPLAQMPTQDKLAGPWFAGTRDVGGADADLILNRTLIDIKAYADPRRIGRVELYQLVGYALLDYDDGYQLESAGFYLARSGTLVSWQLDDLLTAMGATIGIGDLRDALASRFERERKERAADLRARLRGAPAEQDRRRRPRRPGGSVTSSVLADWQSDLMTRFIRAAKRRIDPHY
ncbi:hypothetical protein ACWGKQ_13545 [Streptomyces sp. NPDC054770]